MIDGSGLASHPPLYDSALSSGAFTFPIECSSSSTPLLSIALVTSIIGNSSAFSTHTLTSIPILITFNPFMSLSAVLQQEGVVSILAFAAHILQVLFVGA